MKTVPEGGGAAQTKDAVSPTGRQASSPYYQDSRVTIYHGDCREIAPSLGQEFAVVSDPPYGMDWDTDTTRFSGGHNPERRGAGRNDRKRIHGDAEPFDPSPFLDYPEVILWGFNHFPRSLPAGGALVWLKRHDDAFGSFLSDAELAWVKGRRGVFCRRDLSMNGLTRARAHPTQKPVSLFKWCIGFTYRPVLDPFAGSGTTLVAAKDLNRRAVGIEIEERYCEIAAERCRQQVLGLSNEGPKCSETVPEPEPELGLGAQDAA